MKAPPFAYLRATDLADVWRLRSDAGPSSQVLAGGQSLLAGLAFRLAQPSVLIDITRIAELKGLRKTASGALSIGALTTHAEIGSNVLVNAHCPVLADAVPLIAHPAIRNRGTIGGSLAYADPAAELPAICVAVGADIVAVSVRGERRIPAARFFTGLFTTALAEDELIHAIEIPAAPAERRATILEVTRRSGDYAMAGLVLAAQPTGAAWSRTRAVFFGVGSTPVVATRAGAVLDAAAWSDATLQAAQAALDADLDPPADPHGGPGFKRQLARVLLARAVAKLDNGSEARAA